ncbi:magnesium-dependent phosphatase-1 [Aureobasidium pullulans]|uniref:Magnesium-dependent phosphatase-1 n=1 Tax=Aureobasidium pullulans TaxID=5580 RepID=A0A4S9BGL8_AURPU|nr:magnesium-dependent phosphatase-1 [Aureobasidium pullulans]THX10902.1 magnesium-dependent phosphatase-1 [Aureobasidium pullulans]THY43901.1 magnesium-dependent phosphatase-1 [Aureobasidium pullulans]
MTRAILSFAGIILATIIMVRKAYKPVETGDDTTTATAPASEVEAPSCFSDGLPLPQVMVFDLDYTLWPFWVDTHVTGPLKPTKDGLVVKDRYNDSYGFYPDVAAILVAIKEKNLTLCAASRTQAPELAREMLSYLHVPTSPSSSSSPKALSVFDELEIYPGDKKTHFSRIHKRTNIPYEEMLFFDDESRNKNVETLGVVMKLVRDGVSRKEVDAGVKLWRERNHRMKKED